jgi:hypothetical protein
MEATFENSEIPARLLQEFANKVVDALKTAVRSEGLMLTGDLERSIRAGAVERARGVISAKVEYRDLLRIKDIKTLTYFTIPPIRPLAEWVERVGVGKFAYVPGYRGREPGTEIETIYRIARGIQYGLKARPNVDRGHRGVYNTPIYRDLIPEFLEDMKAAALAYAGEQISEAFGFDTTLKLPDERTMLNASRIQAGWNARDTKVAREYALRSAQKPN